MFFLLFTPKKCYFSHFVHHCSKRIVSLYKQRQMERTVTMNDEEGSMLLCPRKERQRMHMNQTQCPIFFLDGPLGESPKGLSEIVLGFSQFRYQFSWRLVFLSLSLPFSLSLSLSLSNESPRLLNTLLILCMFPRCYLQLAGGQRHLWSPPPCPRVLREAYLTSGIFLHIYIFKYISFYLFIHLTLGPFFLC